jgi:hypothetical protein
MLAAADAIERAYNVASLIENQDWTPRTDKRKLGWATKTLAWLLHEMEATAMPACMIDADIRKEVAGEVARMQAAESRTRLTLDD